MPDLCGNCAMNVPRMGICGRKLIAPPSCSSLWSFSALRVQKEAGRGSWVSGWWAAFVAAPSSCSAFVPCFVGIEKYYVFSHHYSLPGEWSSWSSLITDISPIFPALSFLSLMNQLFFPSWWFSSQPASAPTQGPRPARPKSTGNGWLFRLPLIFQRLQVWSHFPNHLMTLSDCRRGRWSRWRRAQWTFAREGKSEQSTSRMCLSPWCLLVAVSDGSTNDELSILRDVQIY